MSDRMKERRERREKMRRKDRKRMRREGREKMRRKDRKRLQREGLQNTQQKCLNREETEAAVREHAAGLKEELNLRLLCGEGEDKRGRTDNPMEDRVLLELLRQAGKAVLWGELCTAENIPWVDEILITEIAYCHSGRKKKAEKPSLLGGVKRVFFYMITYLSPVHWFSRLSRRSRNKSR